MKKSNKLLALLLVLALTVSCLFVFAACNPKDEGGEKTATGAYILSDKGTYLAYKKNAEGDKIANLSLLYEQDNSLKNTYTMIAVDGSGLATPVTLNEIGADCFIKWMSLASTRTLIANFGKDTYNEALFYLLADAQGYTDATPSELTYTASGATTNVIKISTTTSVNDTGLLGSLETEFEKLGWDIQVASAGTGAAITAAKDGNADVLLVHSASQEKAFIKVATTNPDNGAVTYGEATGYARVVDGLTGNVVDSAFPERVSFMYNFFVLLGPTSDPAKVKDAADITAAFEAIAAGGYNFVSRGDTSGTHTAEINLWKKTNVNLIDLDITYTSKGVQKTGNVKAPGSAANTAYDWYISAGQGMGACLTLANEYLAKGSK